MTLESLKPTAPPCNKKKCHVAPSKYFIIASFHSKSMCILKIKKEPLPSYFSIYQNTVIYNYIWLNTVKDLSQTSSCITINVCCKWYNKHTCYQKNHRFMCNVIQSNITVYLQNNSVQTGFHSKKNHYRFITSSIPAGITSYALSNGD